MALQKKPKWSGVVFTDHSFGQTSIRTKIIISLTETCLNAHVLK